ncbi:MAG: phosphatidylethanolamine-binding protein [Planctomycetaceae bacterium]|nr:phosphatidylethanolamine-binding protein [Planctomycetaceae bacterium]
MTLDLTSSAFHDGEAIPVKYTEDGEDWSPPLIWTGTPDGTASLALICDDPDAPRGTWVHWVLFNLPAELQKLNEHVPVDGLLDNGARQGKNDFEKLGYGGPAPPAGKPHRYFFKLHALDTKLNLPQGASKEDLLSAMQKHVLGEAHLMGTYQR